MIGPPRHNSRIVCKTLIICLVRGALPIHYRIIKYISGLPSRIGSLYFTPPPFRLVGSKEKEKDSRDDLSPKMLCRLYPGGRAIL